MKVTLTSVQSRTLDFLRAYHAEYARLPVSRAIAAHFGWSSQTAAMGVLAALTKKGWLEKITPPGGRAFYRLVPNSPTAEAEAHEPAQPH